MTPNPKQYIAEFGGKAGGYFYLRDLGGFEENLLPMIAFIGKDDDFSAIADKPPGFFGKSVIVRGSHPNDYWGLVDTLDTKKDIRSKGGVAKAITEIREEANKPDVYSYNAYENEFYGNKEEWQQYDGKIRIMIQPFMDGSRGSMVENPHEKGTYLIDIVGRETDDFSSIDRIVAGKEGFGMRYARSAIARSESLISKIIELYKRVKETGFIPGDYSFHMEFGFPDRGSIDKVFFYQARPFKRFEEPPFELDTSIGGKYSCFGITPQGGLELKVVRAWCFPKNVADIEHPFAMVMSIAGDPKMRLWTPSFQPKNMAAFIPVGSPRTFSLEHNTYKWIAKAQVSITSIYNEELYEGLQTGDRIRIISNGLNYGLEKLK